MGSCLNQDVYQVLTDPPMVTKPLGLIGVGLLGTALAGRLLGAGFRVVGTDVDPGRRDTLRGLGSDVAAGLAWLVRG